jgi:uncharacterized protein
VTPEQQDVIRYRFERAAEALDEARLLLDKGFLNTCVNRLYYACFFAVSALLLTEGYSSAKHSGLRALFDRHWVKQGRVPVEIGRIYRRFFVNRQRGDYGDFVRFTNEEVHPWIKDADRFVADIGRLVRESLARE